MFPNITRPALGVLFYNLKSLKLHIKKAKYIEIKKGFQPKQIDRNPLSVQMVRRPGSHNSLNMLLSRFLFSLPKGHTPNNAPKQKTPHPRSGHSSISFSTRHAFPASPWSLNTITSLQVPERIPSTAGHRCGQAAWCTRNTTSNISSNRSCTLTECALILLLKPACSLPGCRRINGRGSEGGQENKQAIAQQP